MVAILKGNQLPLSLSTTLNFQFLYSVTPLLINLKKKNFFKKYEKLNFIRIKVLTHSKLGREGVSRHATPTTADISIETTEKVAKICLAILL